MMICTKSIFRIKNNFFVRRVNSLSMRFVDQDVDFLFHFLDDTDTDDTSDTDCTGGNDENKEDWRDRWFDTTQ